MTSQNENSQRLTIKVFASILRERDGENHFQLRDLWDLDP